MLKNGCEHFCWADLWSNFDPHLGADFANKLPIFDPLWPRGILGPPKCPWATRGRNWAVYLRNMAPNGGRNWVKHRPSKNSRNHFSAMNSDPSDTVDSLTVVSDTHTHVECTSGGCVCSPVSGVRKRGRSKGGGGGGGGGGG